MINDIASLLRAEEGLRLEAYKCSRGVWTIGYGCTGNVHEGMRVTVSQAETMLKARIVIAEQGAKDSIGEECWNRLSDVRKAALTSMCYQMGEGGLREFKHTLAAIRAGLWANAASLMLDSKWAKQTPARACRHSDMIWHDKWPKPEDYD